MHINISLSIYILLLYCLTSQCIVIDIHYHVVIYNRVILLSLNTLFYHHRLNLNLHVIGYFSCTIIVKPCYFLYYPLYSCTIIVLTLCTVMMSSLVICPYINRLFGFVFCILLKKTFGSKRSVFINNNFIIVIDN